MTITHEVEILKITPHGLVGVSAKQRARTGRDYFFEVGINDVDFEDEEDGRTIASWVTETGSICVVKAQTVVG